MSWWEPRFEGHLHRDQPWPADLFPAIAEKARAAALHVLEESSPSADASSYRSSAAPEGHSLQLARNDGPLGAWDRIHLWQDGPVLRYGGSFRGWTTQIALFVFTPLIFLRADPGYFALALAVLSILALVVTRWWRHADACRYIESLVKDAETALQHPSPPPPASIVAPPPAPRIPTPLIPASDPSLAATAKAARDAVQRHSDLTPEEEVEHLEHQAKRSNKPF